MMANLNESDAYQTAAAKWQGDFYFICPAEGAMTADLVMYLDLHEGRCLEACMVADQAEKSPAYVLTAPLAAWKQVVAGELDPIQGVMTRKLKLAGDMMQVMRMPKAAIELVNCATQIETSWPA